MVGLQSCDIQLLVDNDDAFVHDEKMFVMSDTHLQKGEEFLKKSDTPLQTGEECLKKNDTPLQKADDGLKLSCPHDGVVGTPVDRILNPSWSFLFYVWHFATIVALKM